MLLSLHLYSLGYLITMLFQKFNLLTNKCVFSCLLVLTHLVVTSTTYAMQEGDNEAIKANSPIAKNDFEWQFMVDLSLVNTKVILSDAVPIEDLSHLQLGLLLDVSYKGFFIQTNSRRSSTIIGGAELGYQFTVQENWQLDLILKTYVEGFKPIQIKQGQGTGQVNSLKEREAMSGIALRYSHFFDNAIFYTDIAGAYAGEDEHGDDVTGLIVDSFYSHLMPYRNWDFYIGVGLTYYGQSLVDNYIGIAANEVSSTRPLYTANSIYRAQVEVYAQYPLSQNWSFNAGLTQSFYSNSIKRSPLIDKNKLSEIMLGVLYVF